MLNEGLSCHVDYISNYSKHRKRAPAPGRSLHHGSFVLVVQGVLSPSGQRQAALVMTEDFSDVRYRLCPV